MLNTDMIKDFIEKFEAKREHDLASKKLGMAIEKLEEAILENLATEGIASIKVNGRTVFVKTRHFAKILVEDRSVAAQAIKDAGLPFVAENFNANTLSAYIRECAEEGKPLPAEFEGIIKADSKQSLGATKAN
ncbi:MAG: hypothetical protein JEZ11_03740 [Desulfobacterales bacterium]|nr:hypothetical protein [Desulfobacterales bacterium]